MEESQNKEYKRQWHDDWLKWISGFANANGGTLYVGVDNLGQAVGLANAKKLLENLPNKVKDILGILVDVNLVTTNNKQIIEIYTQPSSNPISYKGEFYYRSGSTLQELKGSSLQHFLLKKQGVHWDAMTLEKPLLESLDTEAVAKFKRLAVHSKRLPIDAMGYLDHELLEKLMLVDDGQLTRAAVLLFHPTPERFITNAYVRIGLFIDDHANLEHFDEVRGNLFDQVFETIEILKLKYMKGIISYHGIVRHEIFPVPLEALREALLNAIVHKDYATAAPIQISVYPDKIMIWNPGFLPDKWTLDTLLTKHSSRPFNPDIANTFFRSGLIEAWGRGIERIKEACQEANIPTPEWRVDGNDFWTTFYFAESIAPSIEEDPKLFSELANNILLSLKHETLSRIEIAENLGHTSVSGALKAQIIFLLEENCIEYTLPDKPSSPLQKYSITEKGRSLIIDHDL